VRSTPCGGPVSAPVEPARRRCHSRGAPAWAPLGAFLLLAILALGGCDRVCVRHSDCPHDAICTASGSCEYPPEPAAPDVDAGADPTWIPDQPQDASADGLDAGEPDAAAEPPDAAAAAGFRSPAP